ncbi:MAG TPA: phage tail terminator-like protein [Pseudolabrys sp.]|nr:phage tail terminator-like protein [Pseudolabrys sp.]
MTYSAPETKIAICLGARLRDLVLSPVPQIAWPNVKFTPPATTYLRVDNLRNATDRLFIGNDDPHLHQGIYQVTVIAPLLIGEDAVIDTAGLIANHFWAMPRLPFAGGEVRIQKRPDVISLKDDANARWTAPVSIYWNCFI